MIATTQHVREALDQEVTLLDCRAPDEWFGRSSSPYGADYCPRKGHIPGAVWIDWLRFMKAVDGIWLFRDPLEIEEICSHEGVDMSRPVVVYCFKGARSACTQLALGLAGFTDVRNYFGSWNVWSRRTDLPVGPLAHRS